MSESNEVREDVMSEDDVIVRIKDLRKSYDDLEVLRGIDIDVHRGEVVVVLGPSGSGKSTMLRCVNLLEKPTGGQIIFEGSDITANILNIVVLTAALSVFIGFRLVGGLIGVPVHAQIRSLWRTCAALCAMALTLWLRLLTGEIPF